MQEGLSAPKVSSGNSAAHQIFIIKNFRNHTWGFGLRTLATTSTLSGAASHP